jgi:hypothetical protein
MAFLEWLQTTDLGIFVAETLWAYPLFETLHTLGMALLVGSLGLINLRVLGYKRELPIVGTLDLLPLAWLGFSVNLVSGLALFASDAVYFWSSVTFKVKLMLILLAGINAFVLSQSVFRDARRGVPDPGRAATAARVFAASSLVFWVGAIIAGRLIAYLP